MAANGLSFLVILVAVLRRLLGDRCDNQITKMDIVGRRGTGL